MIRVRIRLFREFACAAVLAALALCSGACMDEQAERLSTSLTFPPTTSPDTEGSPPEDPTLSRGYVTLMIDLASTELIGDFCVSVVVTDPVGHRLWSRPSMCSHAFGSAGGLSYIGFCTTDAGTANHLALTLDSVVDANARPMSVLLPCGDGRRCDLEFTCAAGGGVSVEIAPK